MENTFNYIARMLAALIKAEWVGASTPSLWPTSHIHPSLKFGDSYTGSEVDTENTGSDVDGKENVCDGDGIENVGKGIGKVIVKFYE
ncbi:hypothetical protein Tco_1439596 [Tanacetum coccineum]